MLLNVGLAWVAYRQTWPLLTTLTLVLTTLYQWGWVFKFLDRSQLTLAMGIFLLFPLATFVGLILAKRRVAGRRGNGRRSRRSSGRRWSRRSSRWFLPSTLSAVPAYGDRARGSCSVSCC